MMERARMITRIFAAMLALASPAVAQSYPSPTYNAVTITGTPTAGQAVPKSYVDSAVAAVASGSPYTLTLSSKGIVSDATGGIDYGATAPATSCGAQTAAINTIIANASAAATTAGAPGFRINWDVAAALSGPIYAYSNMTIDAPTLAHGAILCPAANSPMIRTHGTETPIASGTSGTPTQNAFGKFDPAHSGDTRYRVFDPAFVNVRNIAIIGGTWNGNSPAQTSGAAGAGAPTATYGFTTGFAFWGVDGLVLRNLRVFRTAGYGIHTVNWRNVIVDNVEVDNPNLGNYGDDSIHFNGPGTGARITNIRTHNGDDGLAFNADDGTASGPQVIGVTWCGSGAITDVKATGWTIATGRDGTLAWGGLRLLSTAARIDDIHISRVSGTTSNWAFLMETFSPILVSGPGNYGRLVFDAIDVELQPISGGFIGTGVFQTAGVIDSLDIKTRYRSNATAFPDVHVQVGSTIKSLSVSGDWYQPAGSANNVPVVKVAGAVDILDVSGRTYRDSSVTVGAAPLVQVVTEASTYARAAGTGSVGTININAIAQGISSMVDIQAGTVNTVRLAGVHRSAGGGAPLAIASGASLTNYVYGSGSFPLVYDHALIASYSGAGAILRVGDFAESATVTATAATLSGVPTTGTQGTPITGATTALTPSGATAYASLTIAGVEQTPRTSFTGTSVPSIIPATSGATSTLSIYAALTGGAALVTSPNINIAAGSVPLPADKITPTAAAAYSLSRKLRAAYAGAAYRVQRSSDSTQQDIGFTAGGVVDQTALLAFVGSGNGDVVKIYDQISARDVTFTSSPRVVASGTVNAENSRATAVWTASAAGSATGFSGFGSTMTMLAVARDPTAAGNVMMSYVQVGTPSYAGGPQGVQFDGGASPGGVSAFRSNTQLAAITSSAATSLSVMSAVFDGTNATTTLNGLTSSPSASTGAFVAAGTLIVGGAYSGSAAVANYSGSISELWLYPSALGITDLGTLKTDFKTFYGTP